MPEGVFFTSTEHKSRFLRAMQEIGKVYDGKLDQEYGAALYLLTADTGTWKSAKGYVSRRGIGFETMLEEMYLSSGEEVLVKLAGNLFNGNQHIDPLEFMRLDPRNFRMALTALQLRRCSPPLSAFQKES